MSVSTLAYDYGEHPPAKTQPRANVVIRLCTGSMNFAQPITDPSNAAFRTIVEGWRHHANATRLRIWDYVRTGALDSIYPLLAIQKLISSLPPPTGRRQRGPVANVSKLFELGTKYSVLGAARRDTIVLGGPRTWRAEARLSKRSWAWYR